MEINLTKAKKVGTWGRSCFTIKGCERVTVQDCKRVRVKGLDYALGLGVGLRLQQPVQNPINDNTNVLWNSPSLGKNYRYRLPLVL